MSEPAGRRTGTVSILFILAIALLMAALFAALSPIVKIVIVSALFAYLLSPVARFLESLNMSRTAATAVIFAALLLAGVIVITAFAPTLAAEMSALKDRLTSEETSRMLNRIEKALAHNLPFLGFRNLDLSGKFQDAIVGGGSWLFGHLTDAASIISSIFLVPFISFFFMKDAQAFKRALISLVPNRYFEFTLHMLYKLNIQFGNYLRGQLIDCLIVGCMATAVLWALKVNYFLMIGAIAGIANIIPYFGPIIGASLAVFVSLLQTGKPESILYIIAAFACIKIIDDALVQPLIVAKSSRLHPLTVLLAVLAGGHLYGILGMLISVPVAGFIKAVVMESVANYRRYEEA